MRRNSVRVTGAVKEVRAPDDQTLWRKSISTRSSRRSRRGAGGCGIASLYDVNQPARTTPYSVQSHKHRPRRPGAVPVGRRPTVWRKL
jgi:hypothetical protein